MARLDKSSQTAGLAPNLMREDLESPNRRSMSARPEDFNALWMILVLYLVYLFSGKTVTGGETLKRQNFLGGRTR